MPTKPGPLGTERHTRIDELAGPLSQVEVTEELIRTAAEYTEHDPASGIHTMRRAHGIYD